MIFTVLVGSKARIETRVKFLKNSKLEPLKNPKIVPTLVISLLGPPADLFLFWSGVAFRLLQVCKTLMENSDMNKISKIQYFDKVQTEIT